jgi:site-specific DNA-methyltransferase (adenine-specific)
MHSNRKWWRYNLVWDKVRTTGFLNARKQPLRCHEDIVVFCKGAPTYNPQMVKCLPHQRNHSRGKQQGEQTNRCYGQLNKPEDIISDEKYPRSIVVSFYKGIMKLIAPELVSTDDSFKDAYNVLDFHWADDNVQENAFPAEVRLNNTRN